MVANSKPYMNFLGGEVSPNVYKRLDMANNGKWFETAKNIYFGTTGDFKNRRGFIHIGKPYPDSVAGEKMKLIPFIYNRSQSYCIAFYNNDFSILKDGQFLTDALGNRIYVQHQGFSLAGIDDLSYCQIGDIVYIAAKGQDNIFTITRKSDFVWEWGRFEYDIPPMRSLNSDKDKTLTFELNNVYVNVYVCDVDASSILNPFGDVSVSFVYMNPGPNYGSIALLSLSSGPFSDKEAFATYFNNNNLRTDLVSSCEVVDGKLRFTSPESTHASYNNFKIRISVGSGVGTSEVFSGDNPFPEQNFYGEYHDYVFAENALVNSARISYKVINVGVVTRDYSFSSSKTLPEFVSFIESETRTTGQQYLDFADYISPKTIRTYAKHTSNHGSYGFESVFFNTVSYIKPSSYGGTFESGYATASAVSTNNIYNVNASFDFFASKKEGEFFCVESLFSPNTEGCPGQNKNYYQSSGSFPSVTEPFWSNGNWRFLTSGLFAGSIELQYSYDGNSWFTHRTFASSIRTESNVSYGTNYNEYGSLDVDDNVLIRLKFTLTGQTNLCVLLDTESFKNRAYYKIIQKNTDSVAIVECVKYNIGTPGITKYNSSTASYDVAPIYEWAESAWSSANGFPKVAFFYQNRLGLANTNRDPQSIWFSRTDNFKDFSTKIEYTDDDPITISALRATGVSEVTTVASAKKLFVFTADHEDGIMDEGALTQANKQLIGFTYYGSESIETRNISNKIIFVERGGHAARALTYDYAQENYEAVDLTIPYKHLLTNEKIIASEYLPGDYKTYLMLTSVGRLICFKYLPEQRIEACSWFTHANGKITNICVVNTEQGYDLYVAVDSGSNKFIEYMNILPYASGAYFDSYKSYTFENAASSITDTSYFVPGVKYTVSTNTERYDVAADNTSTITLKAAITACSVGVKYISEATLIEPNFNMQNGTTNYNRKNMYKAHFAYENSEGFKVGVKNREKSFKQLLKIEPDNKEHAMYPRAGERSFIIQSSYLEPNMLSFVQEEPYPMHITNAEVEVDYGGK